MDNWNEETRTAVCVAAALGATVGIAAHSAGIRAKELERWLAQGERSDATEDYAAFARRYRRAQSDIALHALRCLRAHMEEAPDACKFFLERQHPDGYGKHDKVEIAMPATAVRVVKYVELPKGVAPSSPSVTPPNSTTAKPSPSS